jgi:hypothetical protein
MRLRTALDCWLAADLDRAYATAWSAKRLETKCGDAPLPAPMHNEQSLDQPAPPTTPN